MMNRYKERIKALSATQKMLLVDELKKNKIILNQPSPNKRLIAYIVGETGQLEGPELRHFVQGYLPDYMVPSAFVFLKAFPLTANDKIDRKALPEPNSTPIAQNAFVAPQSETERALATIWQDLLQLDTVGIDDNFFDMGGHSILIVQLHSRVQVSNLPSASLLTTTNLFQYPTIRALAKFMNHPEATEHAKTGSPAEKVLSSRRQSRKMKTNQRKERRQRAREKK